MDEVFDQVIKHYGITALLAILVLAFIFWLVIHLLAAPGKQIALLYGLVSYTKRDTHYTPPKRQKPLTVIHEKSGTLWRIMRPVDEWIDLDLTAVGSTYSSSLLAGPHHANCKADLSYFQGSGINHGYRVKKRCVGCDVEVIPENLNNDRTKFKAIILRLIQEAHLRGEKIENDMLI